jgi:hypothetical protein
MLYHKPIKVIVNNFWPASIVLLESRFSYNTELPILYSVHMYFTVHWRGYWHYYVTFPAANSHLISGQAGQFFFFVLRVARRTNLPPATFLSIMVLGWGQSWQQVSRSFSCHLVPTVLPIVQSNPFLLSPFPKF